MIEYCAICTSTWSDETFISDNFDEVFSFCLKRESSFRSAEIIKVDGQKKEVILSFRTLK